jgi:hypothetical protein
MNVDLFISYLDSKVPKILEKELPDGVLVHMYDETTRTGKKEGWALKSEWGAKESPFALVAFDGIPKKAFYTEAEDVIVSLLKYLKNECKCN